MATNVLGLMDYVQQQGDKGRQQGLQNRFAQLAGQAYSAAPAQQNALVGQAVGVDPRAGLQLGSQLATLNSDRQATAQAAEVDHMKKLGGAARYMAQALKSNNPAQVEGAWQAVRPYLAEVSGKEPPPQWDPAMEPALYQAIAATGGEPDVKGVVTSGGQTLINPHNGAVMYRNPYAPKLIPNVPMGQGTAAGVFDANTEELRPAVGGIPRGGQQGDPMQPLLDQANAAIRMGAPEDKVRAWLMEQAQAAGLQPQPAGQDVPAGGNQLQTTQAVVPGPGAAPAQFGIGTPAGPKPQNETWNQPVDETGPDGKPIRVQYSNTGERRVVEGAAPIAKPNAGAAKKSDEQIKVALYTKGLADDAYAYAAAATGRTQDELRQMTPEQVAALVAQGSRWSSGPVVGRIPGMNPLANADLSAYANSASGKMARMNNPTGPVSNADFEIAAKSVWGPDKPDDVNAQLILNALQREQAMQAGGAAAPNTDTPAPASARAVAPRPRATNPQTGETVEFDGQQWVPVHG